MFIENRTKRRRFLIANQSIVNIQHACKYVIMKYLYYANIISIILYYISTCVSARRAIHFYCLYWAAVVYNIVDKRSQQYS